MRALLAPTWAEPFCDVVAQVRALLDPCHPKAAMWLAAGTRAPSWVAPSLVLPAGSFYGSPRDCRRLEADPSEEMLAHLLGYVEAKSAIRGCGLIAQARDARGCVVSEMAFSPSRMPEAVAALTGHGTIFVTSVEAALGRRAVLIAKERYDGWLPKSAGYRAELSGPVGWGRLRRSG